MATRKQKAKVGLFLMICILLIAGGLLLISGYRHEPKVHYWTEFEESVLGLGTSSAVTYLGVPVGTVSDIYVTDRNTAHVDIEVMVNKVKLRPGVEARLVLYSLATGTLAIGLSGGDPAAPMLLPGSEIPSTPSLVETVSSQVENLLNNLNDISSSVKDVLEGVEDGQLRDVVQSTADLLEKANQFADKANEFADKANEFIDEIGDGADNGIESFSDLLTDIKGLVKATQETIETLRGQIEALNMGETNETLNQALQQVSELAEHLKTTADSVTETGEGAAYTIENIQMNLRETMQVFNETLNSVRDLADYLQQDPSALIRGRGRPRGGS